MYEPCDEDLMRLDFEEQCRSMGDIPENWFIRSTDGRYPWGFMQDRWEAYKWGRQFESKIVIQVRGGVVQDVISNANAEVIVVDYDNIERGDPGSDQLKFADDSTAVDLIISGHQIY